MHEYKMKCPYCGNVFKLTDNQIVNNFKFKCPKCHKYNGGSYTGDRNDVMFGVKLEDLAKPDFEEV